ncbi:MAG: hypothetical protein DDT21_01109 [Syntrophomonadaceae bacterium]|nr:hypothetical protein [Bacillota bacterium]
MKSSIQLLHRLPGRIRVRIGKGLGRAALIESKCRRLPEVYAASYTEQTGTLLLYYNASLPESRVMLWVIGQFSRHKKTAGLPDCGENGPAALPSEIFINILAIAVYAIEDILAPGWKSAASLPRRLISPTVLALLFASKQIIHSGIDSLLFTKQVNAITLTALAILAAAVKGKAGSALLIVTLSNFGEVLTQYTAKQSGIIKHSHRRWQIETSRLGRIQGLSFAI